MGPISGPLRVSIRPIIIERKAPNFLNSLVGKLEDFRARNGAPNRRARRAAGSIERTHSVPA
jgi:hypothetical protein